MASSSASSPIWLLIQLGEHDPGDLVDLADRRLLVRVLRVDPGGLKAFVAARPEQQEPVPPAVERQMPKRPLHAWADLGVIVRVRKHPLRGPLEHSQAVDVVRNSGRDLEAAGARAYHGYPLAAQVDGVVPLRGMERRPGEIPLAVDLAKLRPVQLPDGADHRARRQGRRCSAAMTRPHGRGGCGIVPGRLGHLGFHSTWLPMS